jgi:hypothetical protein
MPECEPPHDQTAGIGVPQVVEPEVRDARLLARRSEAMLNIPDVPGVTIPENISGLLQHLREDSMEGVVDREHAHGVIFGYGQNDEAVIEPNVIPLLPKICRIYPPGNLRFKRIST